MKPVLVVYATREGQTRKIAEHVAATLRARGDSVDVVDAAALPVSFDLGSYAGAVLAASLHAGKHERELATFAKSHRVALERIPTAFLSVSLTEAAVEDTTAPVERRAKAAEDVKKTVDAFLQETGLHPAHVWPVAGALAYRDYNTLVRLVMRIIAKRMGGSTDSAHDHEYTDWRGLDRFTDLLAAEIEARASKQ